MPHSPFPWSTHPQTPTAVFDADGKRIVWDASEDWQTIETAPKDNDEIIAWSPIYGGRRVLAKWNDNQYAVKPKPYWSFSDERIHGTSNVRANQPTHWRPLPAPPSDKPAPTPLDPEAAADNAALIAAIPGMLEALEFYRDGFLFSPNRSKTGVDLSTWQPKSKLLDDCGEKARAALVSIGRVK